MVYAVRMVVLFVVTYFFAGTGLFGYKEATAYFSRDVFYRAMSVAYPHAPSSRSVAALISDSSLPKGVSWPVSASFHAVTLDRLKHFGPKAVFFDMAFIDDRHDPQLETLLLSLEALADSGTKIFMAAASSESGALVPAILPFQHLAARGKLFFVSIRTGREIGGINLYPLISDNDQRVPAAKAIYEEMCKLDNSCQDFSSITEFEIWWAASRATVNCRLTKKSESKDACEGISENALLRLVMLALRGALAPFSHLLPAETDPVPVPYTPIIYWNDLARGAVEEDLARIINGGVVFYGLDLALIRDSVASPVHGEEGNRYLPGVFYHAMAYDNLVKLKNGIIRATPPFGLSAQLHDALLMFIGCVAVATGWCIRDYFGLASWRNVFDALLFAVVILAMAFAEFYILRISPSNWIGIIFASFAGIVAKSGRVSAVILETFRIGPKA